MSGSERDPEEGGEERRRPRVVDKRISARAAAPPPAGQEAEAPPPVPETPAEPAPVQPEPEAAAPDEEGAEDLWTPEKEEQARRLAEEMAQVPSIDWVVNVAVTLANAAGSKLGSGQIADAALAIDAFEGLLTAVGSRLEGAEAPLRQTLAQLQLAYAEAAGRPPGAGAP